MPKSTKAEIEQRVNEVYDLLISRITYQAILSYGASKWGVKERQMNVYIARARERLRELNRESEEERLASAMASYNSLFARQVAEKDYKGARQTMDSIIRLQGLSGKDRKNPQIGLGQKGYVGLDLEEI